MPNRIKRLNHLEAKSVTMDDKIDRIDNKVDNMDARLGNVESSMMELSRSYIGLENAINNHLSHQTTRKTSWAQTIIGLLIQATGFIVLIVEVARGKL